MGFYELSVANFHKYFQYDSFSYQLPSGAELQVGPGGGVGHPEILKKAGL
jgi:hypothetical protein